MSTRDGQGEEQAWSKFFEEPLLAVAGQVWLSTQTSLCASQGDFDPPFMHHRRTHVETVVRPCTCPDCVLFCTDLDGNNSCVLRGQWRPQQTQWL